MRTQHKWKGILRRNASNKQNKRNRSTAPKGRNKREVLQEINKKGRKN
jgi:hypothetical protein